MYVKLQSQGRYAMIASVFIMHLYVKYLCLDGRLFARKAPFKNLNNKYILITQPSYND